MRGSELDFRRVLVVGAGRSGRGAVSALAELAGEIAIVDDDVKRSDWLPTAYSNVVFFGTQRAFLGTFGGAWATLVVLSPGFRPFPELTPDGVQTVGEIELGYRLSRGMLVGVTGTNGKTSVTQMIHQMLSLAGINSVAAGNIGVPFSEVAAHDGIKVVEISSFQLASTSELHLDVAVWTNFAPDHLDQHGSLEAYKAAKERVWRNQGASDLRVLNADDEVIVLSQRESGPREVTFSLKGRSDYGVARGRIVTPKGPLVRIADMKRQIPHEIANLLCASAVALELGAPLEAVSQYLLSFSGFEHRVEYVGELDGVRFYNDSKATSPSATVSAVMSFATVVLLAGGRNKNLDLSELLEAQSHLKKVVVFGEAAESLAHIFSGAGVPYEMAWSMEEAVRRGFSAAQSGDVVLLSPANTSFDWYADYGQRGLDFKDKVVKLLKERGT